MRRNGARGLTCIRLESHARRRPVARADSAARNENTALDMIGIAGGKRARAFRPVIAALAFDQGEPDIGEVPVRRLVPRRLDQFYALANPIGLRRKPRRKRDGRHEPGLQGSRVERKLRRLVESTLPFVTGLSVASLSRRHGLRRQKHRAAATRLVAGNELGGNDTVERAERRIPVFLRRLDLEDGLRGPGCARSQLEGAAGMSERPVAVAGAAGLNEEAAKAEKFGLGGSQHPFEILGGACLVAVKLRGLRGQKQGQRRRIEQLVRLRGIAFGIARIACGHRHHAARKGQETFLLAAFFQKGRNTGRRFDEADDNPVDQKNGKGGKRHHADTDNEACADFIAAPVHHQIAGIIGEPDGDAAQCSHNQKRIKGTQHERA